MTIGEAWRRARKRRAGRGDARGPGPARTPGAPGVAAAALLALTQALAAAPAAQAQSNAATPSFGECEQVVDDAALRAEVASGARAAMAAATVGLDYGVIVEDSWAAVRFDAKFARIVDAEIAVLREDRAYVERLLDGNIPSRAEEMATRAAEAVFGSDEFAALQAELQAAIAERMGPRVADAEIEARSRAADCVRVFLGQRYAVTISEAFAADARTATVSADINAGGVGTGAAISLAGVVASMLAIVFRRLVQRIVAAIVRRLVGAIAARLIASTTIILGVATIVYELVVGAEGVFPLIKDELTSAETSMEIRAALVEELETAAPERLDARAEQIAADMIERWRSFRASHRAVLELAERTPRFASFVGDQPPGDFETLSVVVTSIKARPPGGDAAVLDALDRGVLNKALQIPGVGRLVEAWSPRGVTVEDLVIWRERAQTRFDRALAAELPTVVGPTDLSDAALDALLALDDPQAARRIAGMSPGARGEALALPRPQLLDLATRFNADELTGLLDSLRPAATAARRAAYLEQLVERPGLITRLNGAAGAIEGSAEPSRALDILLSTNASYNPFAFVDHVQAVTEGRVAPTVLAHRYGWGLAIGVGVPLLIAIGLFRWFLGFIGLRRPRRARGV